MKITIDRADNGFIVVKNGDAFDVRTEVYLSLDDLVCCMYSVFGEIGESSKIGDAIKAYRKSIGEELTP